MTADKDATIARLTAQLAEERAARGAVIEKAAKHARAQFDGRSKARDNHHWTDGYDDATRDVQRRIRTIDPDATAALAEYVRPLRERANAAEAELARLREGLEELAKDPRDDSICVGEGWDFYTDKVVFARALLKGDAK